MKFRQYYNLKDSGQAYIWTLIVPQIVVVIFALIAAKICTDIGLTEEQIAQNRTIIILSLLLSQLCFAGVYLIYSRARRVNFINASSFKFKFNIWYLLISIALTVGLLFGFNQFIALYDYGISKITAQSSAMSLKMDSFGMFVVGVLLYAVLPAVCEESLFRGLIYSGLRTKFKPKTAVLLASLMFMLVHMSLHQTIYQFCLGLVLCLIVYFTGSIFYSIIAHFFNNFFIVLITYLEMKKGTYVEYITEWPAWKIVEAVAVMLVTVALIATVFFLWKKYFPPKTQEVHEDQELETKIKASEGLSEYEVRAMNPTKLSPSAWLWISIALAGVMWIFSVFF